MKDLITYNPEGRGNEYGIRYHGEDFIHLTKAIYYLLFKKNMKFPLPSHHGLTFYLNEFDLRLTILVRGWTHLNKGNGQLELRFVLQDENYKSTIDKNGNSIRKSGLLLNDNLKAGFVKALERAGFKIEPDSYVVNGYAINVLDKPTVVATILPNPIENMSIDVKNSEYQPTFDNFIEELKKIFEYHNVIN